jgi:hypothetical protein
MAHSVYGAVWNPAESLFLGACDAWFGLFFGLADAAPTFIGVLKLLNIVS